MNAIGARGGDVTIYRDDLERVYALIERPEAWTTQAFARDVCNRRREFDDQSATCWCLLGAAAREIGKQFSTYDFFCALFPDNRTMEVVEDDIGTIAHFNDSHTHAEVLALLRSAIERAPVRP